MTETPTSTNPTKFEPEISHISEEDENRIIQLIETWHCVERTTPINRAQVEDTLARLYESDKLEMPPVLWSRSPFEHVAMRTLISLWTVTRDGNTDLWLSLRANFNESWRSVWENLEQQLSSIPLPQLDPLYPDQPWGENHSLTIGAAAPKVTQAHEQLSQLLSLPVKLKLRRLLSDNQPANNGVRRLHLNPSPFLTSPLGLLQLRQFLDRDITANFLSQFSEEQKENLKSLCSAKFQDRKRTLMFAMLRNQGEPIDHLFGALHESYHSPAATSGFREVACMVKCLGVTLPPNISVAVHDWLVLKESVFHFEFFSKLCCICELPTQVQLNERNQLNNQNGPAMTFSDGTKLYAWNGVIVPANAVDATQCMTVQQIEKETNVEVRRILIERYGMSRYLEDSGAVKIDEDEYGVLYRKTLMFDEPVVVVRVLNPTPEPDGTNKFYFLRVPPYISTAHSAVAWTFDMTASDYRPLKQS